MSVEAGSGTDKGFLNPPVAIPRGGCCVAGAADVAPGISEARGPSGLPAPGRSLPPQPADRRPAAVVGAFVLTVELSRTARWP